MSGGMVPSAVVPIPKEIIEKICPEEFHAFMNAWDLPDEPNTIDELARIYSYDCDPRDEVDENFNLMHIVRWEKLQRVFGWKTGLALRMTFHDSDSEGCEGDSEECRGVFWFLDFDEVFNLSARGAELESSFGFAPTIKTFGQFCG